MFSLYVPCQQEYEELRKIRDTLKEENSVLTQRLAKLSEKCPELTNENDSLGVNHFNHTIYLFFWYICLKNEKEKKKEV